LKIGSYAILVCLLYNFLFAQDNLHLCVLRVQFQEDNNDLTTGNGRFVLENSDVKPYTIDPPPHNRSYFQDHIISVHHYFQQASSGQFLLSGEVFPLQQDSAYTLEHTMGYYSPNRTEEENNRRLAQLFIDAVTMADRDASVTFSNSDLVVIFHAGVGKDIDLGYDPTPQDIPSLYLSSEFFKIALGDTFAGVPVNEGSLLLDRGIILPETESQEDIEAALTGIFAANIGTHLGMYDLFSPTDQTTGIGRFGLMDAGLFNLYGLAPALPSAFSRELIGWEQPITLTEPGENIRINRLADQTISGNSCYRIPINSDEYFLLEYRGDYQASVTIDSIYQDIYNKRGAPPTYLEVLQTRYPEDIEVSDSTGVLLRMANYDWGLPGSGIAIWHIDALRIRESAVKNAINDDPENRAVDVEEADGSQDIGQSYMITDPGFQSELGTWLDFWFKSNPAPLYKNEFSGKTAPNTLSNRNYANPQIRLTGFSDNKSATMTFTFEKERNLAGFPVVLNTSGTMGNLLLAEVENIDTPVLFICDTQGTIFAVTQNGQGIYNPDVLTLWKFQGSDRPILTLADRNGDGAADFLLAADKTGRVEFFDLIDARTDTTLNLADRLLLPVIAQTPYIYIGREQGTVERYTFTGILDSTYDYQHKLSGFSVVSPQELYVTEDAIYGPYLIDLNGSGQLDIILIQDNRILSLTVDGEERTFNLPVSCRAAPSFADIDQDGFYEIVLTLTDRIHVLNFNGTPVTGFPYIPRRTVAGNLSGTTLIFSADGDQSITLVVNDDYGNVYACDHNGKGIDEFSFTIGSVVMQSGAITDIDGDGYVDYLVANDQGVLQGWRLDTTVSNSRVWWAQSSYDFTQNKYISNTLPSMPAKEMELLPAHRVYNYPNPNTDNYTILRYYLRENAAVSVTIFDLAGDLVDSFSGPGSGKTENEVRWDLTNIASGVYLARIAANSASAKDVRIIKIMVVH
jgi:M6 family metalloprotease-like protein